MNLTLDINVRNKEERLYRFLQILGAQSSFDSQLTYKESLFFIESIKLLESGGRLYDKKAKQILKPLINKDQKGHTQTNNYIKSLKDKGWIEYNENEKAYSIDPIFLNILSEDFILNIKSNEVR
jgi:hypothetical protein